MATTTTEKPKAPEAKPKVLVRKQGIRRDLKEMLAEYEKRLSDPKS